MVQEQILLRNR